MRQLKGLHLATDASDDLSPPTPSGTPTVLRGLYRLSQALREHRISIVNAAPDDVSIRAMAALPAFLRGLSPIRAIRALLKQRSYDFFYSTSPEGLLLLSLARAVGVCRRPIVLGDPGLDRQWRTRHLVLKLVLPHIDAVAAITRGQVGIALSDWNARAAFHSGLNIDTAFFDPPLDDVRPDASYAFAPGEDIGRDYDTLFEAMRRADFRTVIKRSRTRNRCTRRSSRTGGLYRSAAVILRVPRPLPEGVSGDRLLPRDGQRLRDHGLRRGDVHAPAADRHRYAGAEGRVSRRDLPDGAGRRPAGPGRGGPLDLRQSTRGSGNGSTCQGVRRCPLHRCERGGAVRQGDPRLGGRPASMVASRT